MKLSIIIPAYNEAASIGTTITRLHTTLKEEGVEHEILVINGRSTDDTSEIVQKLSQGIETLTLMQEEAPYGFGNAIKMGLKHYTGDAVTLMMADGSDDPQDLISFWHKLLEGNDCVFGSRFSKDGKVEGYPKSKLILNRAFNVFVAIIFNIYYFDFTNSFKLYRRRVIDSMQPIRGQHFNITLELPLRAIIMGFKYTVVPNSWYNVSHSVSNLNVSKMMGFYLGTVWFCFRQRLKKTPFTKRKALIHD